MPASNPSPVAEPPAEAARAEMDAPGGVLPRLETVFAPKEALERLDRASRRGRLPGFEALGPNTRGCLRFEVAAFGEPVDHRLIGAVSEQDGASGGAAITFESKPRWKMPVFFLISVVVSIWPGLPIVDGLIPASWGWWPTWTWYIPLCLLPLPFIPRMWRKSQAAAAKSAHEAVRKIAAELDAQIFDSGG